MTPLTLTFKKDTNLIQLLNGRWAGYLTFTENGMPVQKLYVTITRFGEGELPETILYQPLQKPEQYEIDEVEEYFRPSST